MRPRKGIQKRRIRGGRDRSKLMCTHRSVVKLDQKIIENNPALNAFYLKKLAEISAAGKKGGRALQTAIQLTKDFAEQQRIPWRP